MAERLSGKVLGVDLGTKRIGLAVSDPERRVSVPKEHLEARGGELDADAIAALAAEEGIAQIVVGLPISMSGERGRMARWALEFVGMLKQATALPVAVWDERRSSEQAYGVCSKPARKRKGAVDSVAAALVLQSYLDAHRSGRAAA